MKTINMFLVGVMLAALVSCASSVKPQPNSGQIKEGVLFGPNQVAVINGVSASYNAHLDSGRLVFARCHGKILVTLPCHDDLIPEALPLPEFGGVSLKEIRRSKKLYLSWFGVNEGGSIVRKTQVHPFFQG